MTLAMGLASPAAHAASGELLDLSLDELMAIEVSSASWRAAPLREAGATVTVFQRADIERLGLRHLHEVLAFVPGVYTSRVASSRSVERSVVRGNSGTAGGVLLMIDGQRANTLHSVRPFLAIRDFPLALVERIEVINGPGSARFGGGPSDQVISVTTRRDTTFAGARVGELGTRGAYAGLSHASGDWRISARFADGRESSPTYTNLFDRLQRRTTTEESTHERTALLDVAWRKQVLTLGHHRSDATGYYGLNGTLDPFGTDVTSLGYALYSGSMDAGPWVLDWSLNAVRQEFSTTTIQSPRGTGPYVQDDLRQRSDLDHRGEGASFTAQREIGGHALTLGVQAQRGRTPGAALLSNYQTTSPFTYFGSFQPTGQRFVAAGASEQVLAMFLEDEWRLSDTQNLIAGVRHDRYRQSGNATSPRLGWVWNPSAGRTLKLLYQEAFFPPTLGQLFQENNAAVLGNPNLKATRIRSFEVVGLAQSDAWALKGVVYHRSARDAITLVPTTGQASTFANAGRQRTTGLEASLQWQPSSSWSFTANGSAVLEDDYELPARLMEAAPGNFLSRRTASVIARWNDGPWSATFGSHRRSREPAQIQSSPWRSLLTVEYRPDAEWRLWAHASNVFDVSANDADQGAALGLDANGRIVRTLPVAGREMWVGIERQWR